MLVDHSCIVYIIYINLLFLFSAKTPSQLTHMTKKQANVPSKQPITKKHLPKQSSLDDIENLESTKMDYNNLCPPDETLSYDSDNSRSPSLRNMRARKQLPLDSDDSTRKKVGKHFKKTGSRNSSALSKRLEEAGSMENVSVGHDTTIAIDSVLLRKPKRYEPDKHPLKHKKKHFYSHVKNSPPGPSEFISNKDSPASAAQRVRKNSLPDIRFSTSPSKNTSGSSQKYEVSPTRTNIDNSKLTLSERNSDSENEIMV